MNNTQKKAEEKLYLSSFLDEYARDIPFSINQIPEQTGVNTPDAYIPELKLSIEVKKVIDEAETARSGKWGAIVNNLQTIANNKLNSCNIKGLYSIDVPWDFNLSKNYHKSVIDELFDAILNGKRVLHTHDVTFKIKKLNKTDNFLAFASFGPGGSYDASSNFIKHISNTLPKADIQLGYKNHVIIPEKRVLLLINQEHLLSWKWDIYKGIAGYYDVLLKSQNIDEVWLQHLGKTKCTNQLLFSKYFFNKFENQMLCVDDIKYSELFGNWFYDLSTRGDETKNKLLTALELFLENGEPNHLFTDPNNRISIVKFGEWLLANKPVDKTNWLITKFINDPDPSKNSHKQDGGYKSLHEQILNDGDINSVSGVQGHLAWLIQKLATNSTKDDIGNLLSAYKITSKKLSKKNQNLYLIQQWMYPLIEIANRRIWLANLSPDVYKKFKSLIINPSDGIVSRYSQYKSISRLIINALSYLKDLTTEESEFILNIFKDNPEASSLLVYYALYRERHYLVGSEAGKIFGKIDSKILHYDPKPAIQLLRGIIKSPNIKLNSQIAWQFWKILDDTPIEFSTISPWISLMFHKPYDRELYSKLEMIIEKWYGKTTQCENPSHAWLLSYMEKVTNYVDSHKSDKPLEMWLSIDVVLEKVVELHPESLKDVVEKLTHIWINGAYIGDLGVIFGSYKHIGDQELRSKISRIFQAKYEEMKLMNSKIPEVIFN